MGSSAMRSSFVKSGSGFESLIGLFLRERGEEIEAAIVHRKDLPAPIDPKRIR